MPVFVTWVYPLHFEIKRVGKTISSVFETERMKNATNRLNGFGIVCLLKPQKL